MKVFISQPMNGLSDEDILEERNKAAKYIKNKYPDAEIIESFIYDDAPEGAGRLWYLGKSIQMLGETDAVYFINGWFQANGCKVEHLVALLYNIKIIK